MNIIELAKQAGFVRNGDIGMKRWEGPQSDSINDQDLEAFAALVEEAVRADEREACCAAEVVNNASISAADSPIVVVQKYKASIRARGTT